MRRGRVAIRRRQAAAEAGARWGAPPGLARGSGAGRRGVRDWTEAWKVGASVGGRAVVNPRQDPRAPEIARLRPGSTAATPAGGRGSDF